MEKETLNNNSDVSKDNFNWYSLRVISGKEKNVEENIDYETKTNSIENLIEEIFSYPKAHICNVFIDNDF